MTNLQRAVLAWRQLPKRHRRVAIAILRGEAVFARSDADPHERERAPMFDAAVRLLRAADGLAKKRGAKRK